MATSGHEQAEWMSDFEQTRTDCPRVVIIQALLNWGPKTQQISAWSLLPMFLVLLFRYAGRAGLGRGRAGHGGTAARRDPAEKG